MMTREGGILPQIYSPDANRIALWMYAYMVRTFLPNTLVAYSIAKILQVDLIHEPFAHFTLLQQLLNQLLV